jgi:predicted dehydrogenase
MVRKALGRRDFMKASAGGAVAASLVEGVRPAGARVSPSEQVTLGIIGLGRQGAFNMRKFLEHPQCRVLAVCDVYQPHLERGREETGADAYRDFRHILDRRDIDVAVISTPDHWHAAQSVMACRAGKDVYVEKPTSLGVAEGRKMVEAARKYDRVVQVGTQQRSGRHFQAAVELVRAGELGEITAVRTWNFGNATPQGIGDPPDSEPPEGLDWDLWLGPAPQVPFNVNRFGVFPDRWSSFRWFWDYAGGMVTDWGVHLIDIVQWAMGVDAPTAVSASGGKFSLNDNRETPDTLTVLFEYPGFICTYENRECNNRAINEKGYGIEFYGTEGTLFVDRGGFEIVPQRRPRGDRSVPRMYAMQSENVNDNAHDHAGDFLECLRSRGRPISDIEIGHHSTAACLLANISYRTGRKVLWDAVNERIPGDPEADAMLNVPYREPWKLEV